MPDTTPWERILQSQANPSMASSSITVCALPGGLIRVSGAQAEKLLQGQLTCDVRDLSTKSIVWGALCNPKGRVFTLLNLFHFAGAYYCHLPIDLLAPFIQYMDKFAKLSRVTLEEVSNQFIGLGVISANRQALSNASGYPIGPHLIANASTLWCPVALLNQSLLGLGPYQLVPSQHWQQQLIAQQIPEIYAQTSETFTPADLNLIELGAVSFTKGCYCGQEIVARMHHLGRAKKYLAQIHSSANLPPGSKIFAHIKQQVKEVGTVVQETRIDQISNCLAVMNEIVQIEDISNLYNEGGLEVLLTLSS